MQTSLPRVCNNDHLISLALKRRLRDADYVSKKMIRPALVDRALTKLIEINPLYANIRIDSHWENVRQESDPELWSILADENHKPVKGDINDSDEENGDRNQNHVKEVIHMYLILLHCKT